MRLSALKAGFLGTRVGRQTLSHFLVAALLPVLVVSGLGVWYVRQALEAEASERVQRTAKSAAVTLLSALASAARDVAGSPAQAASVEAGDALSSGEESHLRDGGVLLRVVHANADAAIDGEVRLIRRGSDGGAVGTTVRPQVLWGAFDELIDVDQTDVCIFVVGTWQRVHCAGALSTSTVSSLRDMAIRAEGSVGRSREDLLLAAHRDLYLRFELGSPEWRLVAAEVRAHALAPAATVTTSLALMVALAVVGAFAFAHRQIRRSTEPLEALRDATRRVAGGDLDTPVVISSRDEYGELGVAFNTMTNALAGQIAMLQRMDAVDEATLRERRIDAIAETALEGFRHTRRCRFASVVIVNELAGAAAMQWSIDPRAPQCHRAVASIGDEEREVLLANPRQCIRGSAGAVREGHDGRWPNEPAATRIALPLIQDDELMGVITLDLEDVASANAEDIRMARRIADRVALGVANVRLLLRLDALSSGTLRAFARAIDANSHWTAGHSERVTRLAVAIGRQLELPRSALSILYRGGLMHDVGKIGIPPAVLDKASRLDDEERALIERHPEIGERILKPIPAFADTLSIVRSHHERFDGTGYPDRLAGEAIPFLARVLAVADVYDALVSDRPYRAGLSRTAALTMIESGAGSQFDPQVVEALLSIALDRALRSEESDLQELRVDTTTSRITPFSTLAAV